MLKSKLFFSIIVSVVFSFLCCTSHQNRSSAPVALRRAHAHNDYNHARPLYDALEKGFTSIEADIILKNDTLYVAHDPEDIRAGRTLQSLYLDPLYELSQIHGESVYPNWPTVYLMIDLKSDADSTYERLQPLLLKYKEMLTRWSAQTREEKAVTVILSGNRPVITEQTDSFRLVALDGRLDDLEQGATAKVYPWISENWTTHFEWRGVGEISMQESEKLFSIIQKAHQNGQLVRFWATDSPSPSARMAVWELLVRSNVDLINTDDLSGLADYLHSKQ